MATEEEKAWLRVKSTCPDCGHLSQLHNGHCCSFCMVPRCKCESDGRPACHTCKKEHHTVRLRIPELEDLVEALKMAYYSCDSCFSAVWAGES